MRLNKMHVQKQKYTVGKFWLWLVSLTFCILFLQPEGWMLGDLVKNIRERELIGVVWLNPGLDAGLVIQPNLMFDELGAGSASWMVGNPSVVVGRK